MAPKHEAGHASKPEKESENNPMGWHSFKTLQGWERLAVIAGVVVLVYQSCELQRTNDISTSALNESHRALIIDQRPWVQFVSTVSLVVGKALSANVTTRNIGKTPARFESHIVVQVLGKDEAPTFAYPGEPTPKGLTPYGTVVTTSPSTVLFPAASIQQMVAASVFDDNKTAQPLIWTLGRQSAYDSGQVWIAVHALTNYESSFGTKHWTRFCATFAGDKPHDPSDAMLACTARNDVDENADAHGQPLNQTGKP